MLLLITRKHSFLFSHHTSDFHQRFAGHQQRRGPVSARNTEWAVDDDGLAGEGRRPNVFLGSFCVVR